MSDLRGDYRAIKCEVCGVPWDEHTDACPRHAYRPECYDDPVWGEITAALDGAAFTLEEVLARTELLQQLIEASRRVREGLEIGPQG